jgi:hypothetical protein
MILDEYGAEDRSRFSGSIVLVGMVLVPRLPKFEFQSLEVLLVDKTVARPGTLESDLVEDFPQIGSRIVGALLRLGCDFCFCHERESYLLLIAEAILGR